MQQQIIDAYKDYQTAHAAMHVALTNLRDRMDAVTAGPDGLEESADAAYAMKRITELAQNTEKLANAIQRRAFERGCILWVQRGNLLQNYDPIRTPYVTATPDVKQMAKLPNRRNDPVAFGRLMDSLQVPRNLWDVGPDASAAVEPHWPGMVEHLTNLLGEGKPLPPGIDPSQTYSVYKMTLRGKREIDSAEPAQLIEENWNLLFGE